MIINLKDYIPLEVIPRQGNVKPLNVIEGHSSLQLNARNCRKSLILPKFIEFNDNDFMAIGLYLAEGQKFVNLDRKTHHTGEIDFAMSELNCLELFCNFIEKIGISRTELKICVNLNINFKYQISEEEVLDYWIKSLNLTRASLRPTSRVSYTGTQGKKISTCTGKHGCLHLTYASIIFRSFFLNFINKIFDEAIASKNISVICLILKGFFAGDGHVEYSIKPKRKGLYFCNQNHAFIKKLINSLQILGVNSYFITDPNNLKTNGKSLVIAKYSYMKILIDYEITDLISYKKEKSLALMNSYNIINGRFSNKLKVNASDQI